MAQNEFHWFEQALVNMVNVDVGHDFGASPNVLKLAIISSSTTPAVTTANPHWSATGTDMSTNEVTDAGTYVLGGATLANPAVSLANNRCEFDWDDGVSYAADPSNGADAKWGILYDDTAANKPCLGYVDLGTVFDMTTGTLDVDWPSPSAYIDHA